MTRKIVVVSNTFLTCVVETQDGKIIRTAPILQRFTGQPYENLKNWLGKKGPYQETEILDP